MKHRQRLGELLIQAGFLDESQLRGALSHQRQWGRPLGVTLVQLGVVDESSMLEVLGAQLDYAVVHLDGQRIPSEVLELIPYEVAIKHHCIPLFVEGKDGVQKLYLGMSDPTDLEVVDEVGFRTGLRVQPVLVGYSQLEDAIERRYRKLSFTVSLQEDIALQKVGAEAERFLQRILGETLEKLDDVPGPAGPLLQAVKKWRSLAR